MKIVLGRGDALFFFWPSNGLNDINLLIQQENKVIFERYNNFSVSCESQQDFIVIFLGHYFFSSFEDYRGGFYRGSKNAIIVETGSLRSHLGKLETVS